MPDAKLKLSIPQQTGIHTISIKYPETVFRIIAVMAGEENGIALLEFETENPTSVITDIEKQDDVFNLDLLWHQRDTVLVQLETTNPLLLYPILKAGIPVKTPFEVQDGVATWELTTSSDRLSELGALLEEADISFAIEYVRATPSDEVESLLTDRQREVLLAAAEHGYYSTPRQITLTDLSNELGITKATGSDILHRIEGKVLLWFIER